MKNDAHVDPHLRDIFDSVLSKLATRMPTTSSSAPLVISGGSNIFVFGGTLTIASDPGRGTATEDPASS
jgi:hypothetical protein